MENEFVTYEIAQSLKDLGFSESCLAYYSGENLTHSLVIMGRLFPTKNVNDHECLAPLFSQVFRWFRKEHDIHGLIEVDWDKNVGVEGYLVTIVTKEIYSDMDLNIFKTYEEAELKCLEKLI